MPRRYVSVGEGVAGVGFFLGGGWGGGVKWGRG